MSLETQSLVCLHDFHDREASFGAERQYLYVFLKCIKTTIAIILVATRATS